MTEFSGVLIEEVVEAGCNSKQRGKRLLKKCELEVEMRRALPTVTGFSITDPFVISQ